MIDELPQGWVSTTLGELFDFKYGKGLPQEKRNGKGSVRVYGSNGVVGAHDMAMTKGPTIIVGRKGSVGEVHISSESCWPIDTTYFIDEFPCGLPANYWALFLKSLRLGQQDKSSAIPGISRDDIYVVEVPVPPLPEQGRIVKKLETLLGKVEACQQRLAEIPVILKRFRQSVLAAACSGRLTADWREMNQINSVSENGDLPPVWHWTKLEELLPPGGFFDGPFGSNLKTADYTDRGVRVVRLENIGHLRFINEKESYVSLEKYETLTKHRVGAGDIIFASFIDEDVRTCVLPRLPTKAIAKADCFCLRPRPDLVNKNYLTIQLASQESYHRLLEYVHGATRPRVNTTQLRELQIRLCPLDEQNEIVRRVEVFFALADQIEARFGRAKARVEQITQSILAKAFSGELVPQDPNDEPASVLLEQIKRERVSRGMEETGYRAGKRKTTKRRMKKKQ